MNREWYYPNFANIELNDLCDRKFYIADKRGDVEEVRFLQVALLESKSIRQIGIVVINIKSLENSSFKNLAFCIGCNLSDFAKQIESRVAERLLPKHTVFANIGDRPKYISNINNLFEYIVEDKGKAKAWRENYDSLFTDSMRNCLCNLKNWDSVTTNRSVDERWKNDCKTLGGEDTTLWYELATDELVTFSNKVIKNDLGYMDYEY